MKHGRSCDVFKLGSSYLNVTLTTVHHLYNGGQTWNWITFVTQRPSDRGIQRPGDPVDPVTLFYNELQMLTYV